MASTRTLPEIAFVRVLTPGGPYRAGDILSVAFVSPDVGRLAAHDAGAERTTASDAGDLIPETISACVVRSAGIYSAGASLTLSFVDPAIARIHETTPDGRRDRTERYDLPERRETIEGSRGSTIEPLAKTLSFEPIIERESEPDRQPPSLRMREHVYVHEKAALPRQVLADAAPIDEDRIARETIASLLVANPAIGLRASAPRVAAKRGARIRLDWNRDRVRRFVQVVDKLFAVDRLGWYRHVFAMRLLVPDAVICGDSQTDVEALRHLHALRAASIEILGRPLLAAFMPNFSVTAEWLDSLDKPAAARALSGLRESLLPFAGDDRIDASECEPAWTIASIQASEIENAAASSVEALLPLFIPHVSALPQLTDKLEAYRSTLIDIFARTAQPADAVRLNAMSEPNHALDDRLLQLSNAVSTAFGGLVVV